MTTGASNDIERATQLARNMVTKWGLSEKLGPLHYGEEGQGDGMGPAKLNYSGATSDQIDKEAREIIDSCYKKAEEILKENMDILHTMKDALMEYETIDSEQVEDLMARKKVRPPHGWSNDSDDSGSTSSASESKDADKTKPEPKNPEVGGPANQH